MDIKVFRNVMRDMLKAELGADYEIEERDVPKNNMGIRYGLYVRKNGEILSPCFYMEEFYQAFQNGQPLGDLALCILGLAKQNTMNHTQSDWNWLKDWEQVKDRLVARLVNTENNAELLRTAPSVPFLNLSCVFSIKAPAWETSYINITNDFLPLWAQTPESLLRQAIENMEGAEITLAPLSDILLGLIPVREKRDPAFEEPTSAPMYLLTNKPMGRFGASLILSEQVRERICQEFGRNMFLLPSSVHEWLLIPADGKLNAPELRALVESVNRLSVQPEDRLSDSVYLLRAGNGTVEIAE